MAGGSRLTHGEARRVVDCCLGVYGACRPCEILRIEIGGIGRSRAQSVGDDHDRDDQSIRPTGSIRRHGGIQGHADRLRGGWPLRCATPNSNHYDSEGETISIPFAESPTIAGVGRNVVSQFPVEPLPHGGTLSRWTRIARNDLGITRVSRL